MKKVEKKGCVFLAGFPAQWLDYGGGKDGGSPHQPPDVN
jgi:hypothetical protein